MQDLCFASPDVSLLSYVVIRGQCEEKPYTCIFFLPRKPLALFQAVLVRLPMTDGEAGSDSDCSLALRLGSHHEVLAHAAVSRDRDTATPGRKQEEHR